jgi:hypothetical protein
MTEPTPKDHRVAVVFAIPFMIAGFLLRVLLLDRNPDNGLDPCPKTLGLLALILLAMVAVPVGLLAWGASAVLS